ncbi:hypothetical protein BMS3Bbin08_01641 [bacterium BMS3Bbin08]|nr:hypothetical protein BMS3Bbin08_01641 [bacterium BMS3Bbin08]
MQIVSRNNRGLTLVEILVALVITLVVFLGLMQTAMLSMDVNTNNQLREEAVSIAERRIRELRDLSGGNLTPTAVTPWPQEAVSVNFRNFANPVPYTVDITVVNIGTAPDITAKQIGIVVTWQVPKSPGVNLTHRISTLKRL